MAFIAADKELSSDQLKHAVTKLVELILEQRPDLKLSPNKIENIVDNICNVLQKNDMTFGKMNEPEFIQKLSLCITASAHIENNNQFTEVLKNIFEGKGLKLEELLKLKPEEFKKLMKDKFSPDELKKLHGQLEKCCEDLLRKREGFQMQPEPNAAKSLADDLYTNLFGLISSAISGGHTVPVSTYVGNGLGFNDWNPYDGNAPIDKQNSLKDTQFGDSLGLNATTAANYLSFSDAFVESVQSVLYHEGLAPGQQPPHLRPQ